MTTLNKALQVLQEVTNAIEIILDDADAEISSDVGARLERIQERIFSQTGIGVSD